jgi:nucleoside-diphosphate-sugar epimerase
MNSPRVGVVGGAGHVGSALLKTLNADHRLTAFGICRNNVSAARLAAQGMPVRIVRTDNAAQLVEATKDLDILVNCALPQYTPSKTLVANQRLADSLSRACVGKHLIHLSSVAVYGDFIPGHTSLFDKPQPDTFYGRQKMQMEHLLRTLAKKHSVKCTILRVGHVYGPELLWSEAIFDLIKKEGFRLPFDGLVPSNAVWITNLIAGIRELLFGEQGQATFNLVDSPQTTWRDIFDLHSQASGNCAVKPLNQFESEQCFRERKQWAETGMTVRVLRETWRWTKHLPAAYFAAVPTLKVASQWAIANIASEKLDARLWAIYSKRFTSGIKANATPGIPSIFISEHVPGPCLRYESKSPAESLAALQEWHDAISAPRIITQMSIQ